MNSIVQHQFEVLHQTQALRDQLMNILSDDDLRYKLPGGNPTLGEVCREIGEVETDYIVSFRTFRLDFSYRHPDPGIAHSVEQLKAWYKSNAAALDAALTALTEETIQNRLIQRPGFQVPVTVQLHIYREGLLIYYGKISTYLKALNKPFPGDWPNWIG